MLFSDTSSSLPPKNDAPSPPPSHSSFITSLLGYTGAIPFLAYSAPISPLLPTALLFNTDPAFIQVSYGATILSFLGGVHWGTALASNNIISCSSDKNEGKGSTPATIPSTPLSSSVQLRYTWSVLPCLMAWPTLFMLSSYTEAAGVQAGLIGMVYIVDRWFMGRGLLPRWYLKELRLPLSMAASAGLGATAFLG